MTAYASNDLFSSPEASGSLRPEATFLPPLRENPNMQTARILKGKQRGEVTCSEAAKEKLDLR